MSYCRCYFSCMRSSNYAHFDILWRYLCRFSAGLLRVVYLQAVRMRSPRVSFDQLGTRISARGIFAIPSYLDE
jgi:hypothetical protein